MNFAPRMIVLAVLVGPAASALAGWPQWRGPDRSGYVESPPLRQSLPPEGLQPLWKLDDFPGGNSGGWSSPIISEGRVYVYSHTKTKNPDVQQGESKYPWLPPEKRGGMSDAEYEQYEINRRDENERQSKAFRFEERLVCLQLDSGEVVWDRTVPSTYTRFVQSGTPCIADGRVFVLGAERTARCFDADTGEVIWNQRLSGEFRDEFFASSFAVSGDVALIACGPLFALDTNDGRVLWQGDSPLDYQSHSSPAVWHVGQDPVAIVNTAGGITQAYRIADGQKLWELQAGAGQSTPLVVDDLLLVYGSSRKNGLTAFQLNSDSPAKEPTEVWQFNGAADSGSTPVVRGDAAFVQGDKRLAKVDLSDGDTQWQTTLRISNPRYTSLVAAGDQLFYGWEGLQAFAAEGDDFQQLYDARVDRDGLLIGSDDLRQKLRLSELASEPEGQQKSEKLWQDHAINAGPLACSTPAISSGLIVLRLRNAVACYDLRQQP